MLLCEKHGKTVGPHGLGMRNERGERLIDRCEEKKLAIMNTWFADHLRRRYTLASPGDRTRNQIGYIMINERYRSSVSNARAYPGADANSDHNPVIATIKIYLMALKHPKRKPRFLLDTLKNPENGADFSKAVFERLPKIQIEENSQIQWTNLKTSVITAANNVIPKESKKIKQPHWVADEIKSLFHKRRQFKSDQEKYKRIDKEIQKQCKCAKEQWLEEKCQEIERFKDINIKEMFKKIREIARKGPLPASRGMQLPIGRILWEPDDIAKRWEKYIASLFHDDREDDDKIASYESGPSILKEVRRALQHCKTGKAVGPNEVVVEMLIALQEDGVDVLWSLFKNIYETGQIPSELLKSVFIAIPKKSNALDCENHTNISLMAHTLKLFLKIILRRIRRKILFPLQSTISRLDKFNTLII